LCRYFLGRIAINKIPVYFAHSNCRRERAMLKTHLLFVSAILFLTSLASADTVVLRNGTSYLGQLQGGAITFGDTQGAKYEFPEHDVQSLVFSPSGDVVTLRNGQSYSGHFTGSNPVSFTDAQGIQYQFPVSDLLNLSQPEQTGCLTTAVISLSEADTRN
jgi:hypothetical protein